MADRITLRGIKLFGFHGVLEEERQKGQYFEIDAVLFLTLKEAAASDSIKDAVDYTEVYGTISAAFLNKKCSLIETLAEDIAGEILRQHPAEKVVVRVRKPQAAFSGEVEYAEVEIERERNC